MGTKLGLLVGAVGVAVIACGADAELADGAMQRAGDILVDAGQALADAGSAMVGADVDSSVSAQVDASSPMLGRRVLESSCDQVRTDYTPGAPDTLGIGPRTQRFARFDVALDAVRSVWACGDPSFTLPACPSGRTCTGAVVGAAECVFGMPTWHDGKSLWTLCGSATSARVVVD